MATVLSPVSPALMPPSPEAPKAILPRRAAAVADKERQHVPQHTTPATSASVPATTASLTTGSTAASSAVPSPAELGSVSTLTSGGDAASGAENAASGSASGSGAEPAAAPSAPPEPNSVTIPLPSSVAHSAAPPSPPSDPSAGGLLNNASATALNALHAALLNPSSRKGSSLAVPDSHNPQATPQTGAGRMAAAASAGMQRQPEAKKYADDDHPLSDRSLSARGYHTLHAMGHLFHVPDRWRLLRPLGQGAYGLVVSVQDTLSGEPVAVKCITRVFDKAILARRALREITLLRHFGEHENLTGLIDLDNVWDGYNEIYLYMEPMEADLHQIVRSGQPLSNLHIQFFVYQLLRGMKYIHSANVIHRDLKPGNLLVNSDCELKICDFGLARGFVPAQGEAQQGDDLRMTEYVATRWYRAPEIMLSNRRYTTAIDVWSIGCILGELLGGKPMFKGKDYVDQLNLILGVLGTPDDATLARISSEKARMYLRTLPHSDRKPFPELLPNADPEALDLLGQLLAFDPAERPDVPTALEHPYVSTYHDPADEPECEVFNGWDDVESLQTLDELKGALTRQIAEYRAEVRGLGELDDGFDQGDYRYEGDAQDLGEDSMPQTETEDEPESRGSLDLSAIMERDDIVASPTMTDDIDSPAILRSRLGRAAAAGRSPTLGPRRQRSVSSTRVRAEGSRGSSVTRDYETAMAGADDESAPPKRPRAPRRSSSQASLHNSRPIPHRRSTSFLFGGMNSLAMTSTTGAPGGQTMTASSGEPSSTVFTGSTVAGRRSRAPSSNFGDILRPLIRQLSTTNLADLKDGDEEPPLITHSPGDGGDGPVSVTISRRGSRVGSRRASRGKLTTPEGV